VLVELSLKNFKCFRNHTIPLRQMTILVGRNNAGKSTIVEALRLLSLVVNRLDYLHVQPVPRWLDVPSVQRGVSPSLEHQDFNFEHVFHRYGDPPALVTATFDGGAHVLIYIGGPEKVHAVIRNADREVIVSKAQARRAGVHSIGILPQVAPLLADEKILTPNYVRGALSSTLAPRHFRNQLNLLYDEAFTEFKQLSESTWPGLQIVELKGRGGRPEDELELLVRNEDFVAEVSWMGHGLQMWLQTMWFLARSAECQTVILDEPDVYMHPDLQRRLIRFLKRRYVQIIVATHSVEIMSEVSPDDILVIDRGKRQARFASDVPAVQRVIDQIGGVHNLQLARLWSAKKCLFIEGKDLTILKYFQNTLFPASQDPIDSIPNMSIGGWDGWKYAIGSSMLIDSAIGEEMRPYCLLDSDFHTEKQIAKRYKEAEERGISLHIWSSKEIENYLLVPAAIQRIIRSRAAEDKKIPSRKEILDKLFAICGEMKHDVMDGFVCEYHSDDKAGGPTGANRAARQRMEDAWDDQAGRIAMAPGKRALSKLSEWSQSNYGVALSAAGLARELNADEISPEIRRAIAAIENKDPF